MATLPADYLRRAAESYAAGAHGFYRFHAWGKAHTHLVRGITDANFVAKWRAEISQGKKP